LPPQGRRRRAGSLSHVDGALRHCRVPREAGLYDGFGKLSKPRVKQSREGAIQRVNRLDGRKVVNVPHHFKAPRRGVAVRDSQSHRALEHRLNAHHTGTLLGLQGIYSQGIYYLLFGKNTLRRENLWKARLEKCEGRGEMPPQSLMYRLDREEVGPFPRSGAPVAQTKKPSSTPLERSEDGLAVPM